ncbi:hypothetical protein BDA99DRAFT_526804 [Phascolomyces articulosus]|uniref:F-box domain-containing protein n=1 Tax=Phascolomyces articulosus TaxID=60185 RepID=A0AAD5P884_9FUNG|nr:hypothetical protein BDA99DRAFT_526804 [Phascolomyces articulosus]
MTANSSSCFNPLLSQTSFGHILNAHHLHHHDQVIHLSAETITHVQQCQLFSLLNLRAQALAMKGQFSQAVADAQTMIQYAPTWILGYLRLADLLSMQGNQVAALKIYDQGLIQAEKQQQQQKDTENNDPIYTALVEGKKQAMEKNNQRWDIIMMLPLEVADSIFTFVPELTKLSCMEVSMEWRDRLANSARTWATVKNNYYYYDEPSAAAVLKIIPYVARHVKDLKVNTNSTEIGRKYLEYFENGDFKKLKILELTAGSMEHIVTPNTLESFTRAIWQMRHTLTVLDLTIDFKNIPISVAELLFYTPHLKALALYIDDTLQASLGDMECLGGRPLVVEDFELETNDIRGRELAPILEHCPRLRRLHVIGADPSVIDTINDIHLEHLEIFAYNSTPAVTSLEALDREEYDGPPGLREIMTPSDRNGVPAGSFIQLLCKHQRSLQRVVANLSITNEQEDRGEPYPGVHPTYQQWHFERIQQLTYWPDIYDAVERLFLESITSCTTRPLELFSVVNSNHIPRIINTLIHLPPVKKLEFTNIFYYEHDDMKELSDAMIRLFKTYLSLPLQRQTLHTVSIQNSNFFSDPVLSLMTQFQSLRGLQVSGGATIDSRETLCRILNELKDQLTQVKLMEIYFIDDGVMDILGNMPKLEKLTLGHLDRITDQGLIHFAEKTRVLKTLVLDHCTEFELETLEFVNSKIKNVDVLDEDY